METVSPRPHHPHSVKATPEGKDWVVSEAELRLPKTDVCVLTVRTSARGLLWKQGLCGCD